MTKNLTFLCILLLIVVTSKAQFHYSAANAESFIGTYTDLGSNGAVITTDYAGNPMVSLFETLSSTQYIGFNFIFNGVTYNQLAVGTNGFIRLGKAITYTSPLDTYIFESPNGSGRNPKNVICPFLATLSTNSSTEYRISTDGVPGSQVCTIQFKNLQDNTIDSIYNQFSSMEFQVKLYETTNTVEFVYGKFVPTKNAGAYFNRFIGLKGKDMLSFVGVYKRNDSIAWKDVTFVDSLYYHSFLASNQSIPVVGQTYRFKTNNIPVKDATVEVLYYTPKILVNNPHTVSAYIRNKGDSMLTNVKVTLSLSGANTFTQTKTIDTLAIGQEIIESFDSFTPLNIGVDTVKVSLSDDDYNANNFKTGIETITNSSFSTAINPIYVKSGSGASYKYQQAIFVENGKPNTISSLTTYFYKSLGAKYSLGIYADSSGKPKSDSLWVSDTLTVDSSIIKVSIPNISVSGNFFVILTNIPDTITQKIASFGCEIELPLRPNTFRYRSTSRTYWIPWNDGAGNPTSGLIGSRKLMLDVSYGIDLPVKLQSFSALVNNNNIQTTWSTSSELNTNHFIIQHSTNGSSFTDIGNVKAIGSGANGYSFTDTHPNNGTNYYRLKSVDKDGASTFSKVVSAEIVDSRYEIVVVPNPVRSLATIKGNHIASVQVVDNIGRVVKTVSLKDATNPTLAVGGLHAGVYHLRVETSDGKVNGANLVVSY